MCNQTRQLDRLLPRWFRLAPSSGRQILLRDGRYLTKVDFSWGTYRGQPIGPELLRTWLDQFETKRDQRLMYQLLRGVRFCNQHRIREKLREAMGIAKRHTIERRLEKGQYRRDIVQLTSDSLEKRQDVAATISPTELMRSQGQCICQIGDDIVSLINGLQGRHLPPANIFSDGERS